MARLKLIATLAALAAAFFAGWTANGWRYQTTISASQARAADAIAEVTQHYRASEHAKQEAVDALAKQQALAAQHLRQTADSIKSAVARYAATHGPATSKPGDCHYLDTDWVRLHNLSAHQLPATAAATGRPAAATPAAALDIITDNYSRAHTCQRRLKGWQAWYRQLKDTPPNAKATKPAAGH